MICEKTYSVTEIHFVSDRQTNIKDILRYDNSTDPKESRVASLSCNGAKSELQTSSTCIQPRNGLHVDTKQPQAMWILACLCSLNLILKGYGFSQTKFLGALQVLTAGLHHYIGYHYTVG